MESYLISYEYKEKNGILIETKTDSVVIDVTDSHDFNRILEETKDRSYDRYLKILFCELI